MWKNSLDSHIETFDKHSRYSLESSARDLCYCDAPSIVMERWVYHIAWLSGHPGDKAHLGAVHEMNYEG